MTFLNPTRQRPEYERIPSHPCVRLVRHHDFRGTCRRAVCPAPRLSSRGGSDVGAVTLHQPDLSGAGLARSESTWIERKNFRSFSLMRYGRWAVHVAGPGSSRQRGERQRVGTSPTITASSPHVTHQSKTAMSAHFRVFVPAARLSVVAPPSPVNRLKAASIVDAFSRRSARAVSLMARTCRSG